MSNNKVTNLAIGLAHIKELQNTSNNIITYQPDVSYLKLEGNLSVSYNLNLLNQHLGQNGKNGFGDMILLEKDENKSLNCEGSFSIKENINIEKNFILNNKFITKKYDETESTNLKISDKRVGIGTTNPDCILDIIDKKNCTINDIIELNMDSAIKIPCGNDDERPWTGNAIEQKKKYGGFIRYNTRNKFYEGYSSGTGLGGAWTTLGAMIDIDGDTAISFQRNFYLINEHRFITDGINRLFDSYTNDSSKKQLITYWNNNNWNFNVINNHGNLQDIKTSLFDDNIIDFSTYGLTNKVIINFSFISTKITGYYNYSRTHDIYDDNNPTYNFRNKEFELDSENILNIGSISIYPNDGNTDMPSKLVLQYSNNGTSWKSAKLVDGVDISNGYKWDINFVKKYNYYRLILENSNSNIIIKKIGISSCQISGSNINDLYAYNLLDLDVGNNTVLTASTDNGFIDENNPVNIDINLMEKEQIDWIKLYPSYTKPPENAVLSNSISKVNLQSSIDGVNYTTNSVLEFSVLDDVNHNWNSGVYKKEITDLKTQYIRLQVLNTLSDSTSVALSNIEISTEKKIDDDITRFFTGDGYSIPTDSSSITYYNDLNKGTFESFEYTSKKQVAELEPNGDLLISQNYELETDSGNNSINKPYYTNNSTGTETEKRQGRPSIVNDYKNNQGKLTIIGNMSTIGHTIRYNYVRDTYIISNIVKDGNTNPILITLKEIHTIENGKIIKFLNINGMTELNYTFSNNYPKYKVIETNSSSKTFRIKNYNNSSIDSNGYSDFTFNEFNKIVIFD